MGVFKADAQLIPCLFLATLYPKRFSKGKVFLYFFCRLWIVKNPSFDDDEIALVPLPRHTTANKVFEATSCFFQQDKTTYLFYLGLFYLKKSLKRRPNKCILILANNFNAFLDKSVKNQWCFESLVKDNYKLLYLLVALMYAK